MSAIVEHVDQSDTERQLTEAVTGIFPGGKLTTAAHAGVVMIANEINRLGSVVDFAYHSLTGPDTPLRGEQLVDLREPATLSVRRIEVSSNPDSGQIVKLTVG